MRIYMQTSPAEGIKLRFFQLHLQADLLGGWTLVKESGQQGSAGKLTRTHFETHEKALSALISVRDKQLNKGFKVVFAEGSNQIS